ncbi:hypothetical protein Q9L58_007354 [Maublancomyces gigas]|uniref:IBR domain-containing protein n=1 Tax=Discina gigas TaxID=1032678 RepID=A0ABR3GCV3_9PEZI
MGLKLQHLLLAPRAALRNTSPAPPIVQKAVPAYRTPTRAEVVRIPRISRNSTAASTIETTPLLPKPPPSRPALAATTKALTTATTPSTVRKHRVTCYICLDVHEVATTTLAPCKEHWYCTNCLRNLFIIATKDESVFPPSCCRKPFEQSPVFLSRYLTWQQEAAFLQAAREFATPAQKRVYCALASCGRFLTDGGEVEMWCRKCGSRTCRKCKEKMHPGVCKDKADEAMKALMKMEGCKFQFCYICGLEWKTCECTRETPRPGLLGVRLAERQVLRETTRQAAANSLHTRGGPAPARAGPSQVARLPRVTRPEDTTLAAARTRAPRVQVATPERPPRAAPRRAVGPEAVSATRGPRGGRTARTANVSGAERPAAVSNAVATRQARCQVHTAWRKMQRAGTCGMCRNLMPRFIFECTACGMDACARCSGR